MATAGRPPWALASGGLKCSALATGGGLAELRSPSGAVGMGRAGADGRAGIGRQGPVESLAGLGGAGRGLRSCARSRLRLADEGDGVKH